MPPVGTLEIMVILLAVLLFGPKRIPEIARQVGKAMSELRRASNGLMKEITKQDRLDSGPDGADSPPVEEPSTGREKSTPEVVADPATKLEPAQIREAAEKLGIETEGRTVDDIRSEMMERIYAAPSDETTD